MKIDDRFRMEILVIDIDDRGVPGNAYDDFARFRKENPSSGYKFGFCIVDTTTGYVPDQCNDWNESPEEALSDYYDNCQ